MEPWLTDLLAACAGAHADWADMHWSTRRRIAIRKRWPEGAQMEALSDHALGRTAADGGKWETMQAEIAAIKAANPKEQGP